MNATPTLTVEDLVPGPYVLWVDVCAARRGFVARFCTEAQAIEFIERRSATHAFSEVEAEPIPTSATALLKTLYPECEHGLSLSNCFGPQHYAYDEEEQARGLHNGW